MLTEDQRSILAAMERSGIQALWFEGQWRFRGDVREDPPLAARMVAEDAINSAPRWPL
jgi:hypothetical protein